MARKLTLIIIACILVLSLDSVAFADLSVGVKKGDWIEYKVSYTGSPVAEHDVVGARMEVLEVQGSNITVRITSRFSDGSTEQSTTTLNLETGHLIDNFIIPANLNAGDTFFAENLGNVTITKAEQRTYVGATRTVLYASTSENTYIWDKVTGVSVEGNAATPHYTIHTIVENTNMWQPAEGQNWTILIAVVLIVLVAVALVTGVLLRKKKKRS
ncbi:MAG: hypothetical protein NWE95_09440 [Candidatus Bathyarchaeota archaeon]|nr:hypothetical protein [Candidatus Bathyarchaeota archaeon]